MDYETKIKKWGNSYGVLVPKEIIQGNNLKENSRVCVVLAKPDPVLKRTFGVLKGWKKSSQKIKDELRRELYD